MEDRFRITVIATGFEKTGMPRNIMERSVRRTRSGASLEEGEKTEQEVEFVPRSFNTENLDIPTFLRNRNRTR